MVVDIIVVFYSNSVNTILIIFRLEQLTYGQAQLQANSSNENYAN
jgi:hypothetical protein